MANNVRYIQSLADGVIPFELEELTVEQQYNEIVMTGLRTSRGIDLHRIRALGENYMRYLDNSIEVYVRSGKVFKNAAGHWALKPEYLFFSDGMAADLFFEHE